MVPGVLVFTAAIPHIGPGASGRGRLTGSKATGPARRVSGQRPAHEIHKTPRRGIAIKRQVMCCLLDVLHVYILFWLVPDQHSMMTMRVRGIDKREYKAGAHSRQTNKFSRTD